MILADENINASVIKAIKEAGIEVISVFEEKRGISDEEVIAFSKTIR